MSPPSSAAPAYFRVDRKPGGLIALLWLGVAVLAGSVITLGIGLITARGRSG